MQFSSPAAPLRLVQASLPFLLLQVDPHVSVKKTWILPSDMRWTVMNEMIKPTSFWAASWPQPMFIDSMTCESYPFWRLSGSSTESTTTQEWQRRQCGNNQGVNKVWMGATSTVSLPLREGGYDKSKARSLSGKLTKQPWHIPGVSGLGGYRGQGDADFQKNGGEMSHADNSKPARRKLL